jgi:hypothetical protein
VVKRAVSIHPVLDAVAIRAMQGLVRRIPTREGLVRRIPTREGLVRSSD